MNIAVNLFAGLGVVLLLLGVFWKIIPFILRGRAAVREFAAEEAHQEREAREKAVELLSSMASSIEAIQEFLVIRSHGSVGDLATSIQALTVVMTDAAPNLAKIGDDAFLIARGSRDIGDAVTALRAVVYGGQRVETFPDTIHDDERVHRSNMEYDIQQLMLDHGLPRQQAEARIKDMYAGRRMG